MIDPPVVRLEVPRAAPEAPRDGFPWLPTLVPLGIAVILVVVTGSPIMLVVALGGPLLAVSGLLASRRAARRRRRSEGERVARDARRAAERAAEALAAERARLDDLAAIEPRWFERRDPVIAIARGRVPSGLMLDAGSEGVVPPELRGAESIEGAPVLGDVRGGVWIEGSAVAAAAAARVLVLRVAAISPPGETTVSAPADEEWVRHLPHRVGAGPAGEYRIDGPGGPVLVAWGGNPPPGARRVSAGEADAASRPDAARAARRLAERAVDRARPAEAGIPGFVNFADLEPGDLDTASRGAGPRSGLPAALGADAGGPVWVDLVTEGPHAIVGGTTGSGKSEALVSWVAALARGRDPREVAFVLLDFKGGAAFDRLRVLPHVAAVVTDLDPRLAARALDALAGELERRERVLAAAAAASIDALAPRVLPRLVVVVDEYAAMVARHPGAAAVVADLAARGRSLGIHLILGTQRPGASIGDAVLANVALRLVLRVADGRDSAGLLGTDAAARIPASARGRAVLVGSDPGTRTLQVAICRADDLTRLAAQTRGDRAVPPWSPPLPEIVTLEDVRASAGSQSEDAADVEERPGREHGEIDFGLRDAPREAAARPAAWGRRHGHLLVIGGPGAGASTALETVAASAGAGARWLPSTPADLWGALTADSLLDEPGVLLADDLDATLAAVDADHAVEIVDLVARVLRAAPRHGVRVAASVRAVGGPMRTLASLFGARLLLRVPTREEHVLAGGAAALFDPRARPGAAEWEGDVVQVALAPPAPRRAVAVPEPERVALGVSEVALVSSQPAVVAERWCVGRWRPVGDGAPADPARPVLLGDVDAWLADWATLARARRELPLVMHECSVADLRALTRSRTVPPILAAGEVWVVRAGEVRRAVLESAPATGPTNDGNRT